MAHAVKRSLGGESRSTRDKRIPDIHERADQALVAAPLTKKTIAKEEDVSWQQLLDLNSTLPKVRGRGEDGGLRLRNFFLFIADSAQTEYCTTFHCSSVRPSQAWHLTFLTYIKA